MRLGNKVRVRRIYWRANPELISCQLASKESEVSVHGADYFVRRMRSMGDQEECNGEGSSLELFSEKEESDHQKQPVLSSV